jgi:hypothetical protein
MRSAQFIACIAALAAFADSADGAALPLLDVVWSAPVGHRQPRAEDIPCGIDLSPSQADRDLDRSLQICRDC